MIQIATTWAAIKANRRGVSALEFALLAGIIVATIAIGFASLANALSTQFTHIGGRL